MRSGGIRPQIISSSSLGNFCETGGIRSLQLRYRFRAVLATLRAASSTSSNPSHRARRGFARSAVFHCVQNYAEPEGFEPSRPVKACLFSKEVCSTTPPRFQFYSIFTYLIPIDAKFSANFNTNRFILHKIQLLAKLEVNLGFSAKIGKKCKSVSGGFFIFNFQFYFSTITNL